MIGDHLNSPHRQFLHRQPHLRFDPSPSEAPDACLCGGGGATTHECATCALRLCDECVVLITSRLMRGSLARLVATVARHKLGYSARFLEREQREHEADPRAVLRMRRRVSPDLLGSGLRLEVFEWMLWDESSGSSHASDMDGGEEEEEEDEEKGRVGEEGGEEARAVAFVLPAGAEIPRCRYFGAGLWVRRFGSEAKVKSTKREEMATEDTVEGDIERDVGHMSF